jgi:uncharacterized radical SAM protein YgiQ
VSLVTLKKGRAGGRAEARADRLRRFLPTTREELEARGWTELDVLLVSGDAYVDHPAFGAAIIGRFLEGRGFRVGVVAQPDWTSTRDLLRMGAPRLFVGITAGNMDSMLNKLTAQKKVRSVDQYSPGGRTGLRPNRATIVYGNLARQAFPGVPIVLGGIEASLRRIAHYDYWSDAVRRSVLLDAKADLLIFGMGERPVWEVADRLRRGQSLRDLRDVRGTAHALRKGEWEHLPKSEHVPDGKPLWLPSHEEVAADKRAFAEMSRAFQYETNPGNARPLVQPHGHEAVYLNPPALPLETADMDALYDLPFERAPHFEYGEPIPAFETVKHSIVTMRGCFGGCTFCSITEHEGRVIQSRSAESVLREVRALRRMGDFSGVLSDLGGPTANMYQMTCRDPRIESACRRLSCVHPGICENLVTDHGPLLDLLRRVREEPGVKKVFLASGVRYDLAERSPEFVRELAQHHTGGQLSVAPEHSKKEVLDKMKKPGVESYERFAETVPVRERGRGQGSVPGALFHLGPPGQHALRHGRPRALAEEAGAAPAPGARLHPHPHVDGHVHVPHGPRSVLARARLHGQGRARQTPAEGAAALLGPGAPRRGARGPLLAGRGDLIGTRPHCLVPPAHGKGSLSVAAKRASGVGPTRGRPRPAGPARPAGNKGS